MADVKNIIVDGVTYAIKDETARNEINSIDDEILTIKDDVSANDTAITSLKTEVRNGISFAKTILIGDSFLNGTGATSPATENWGAQIQKYITGDFKTFANGGGGFLTSGATGTNFTGQISPGGAAYTAFSDRNEVTAIIAVGGVNDGDGTIDTIYNATKTFVQTAKANFPNAKVFIVYNPTVAPTLPCQQFMGIVQAAVDTGAFTAPMSFGWIWEGRDLNNSGDNIHPNSRGYALMGSILAGWLLHGSEMVPVRTTANGIGGLIWYFTFDKDNLYIRVAGTTTGQLSGNILTGMAKCLTPGNDVNLPSGIQQLEGLTLKGGNIAVGGIIPQSTSIYFNQWIIPKSSLLPNMFKNH